MTYRRFLSSLRRTAREWTLNSEDQIRLGLPGSSCPITAVCRMSCGSIFENSQYRSAARVLKLRLDLSDNIVLAADHRELTKDEARIRKDLLRATGLLK